MKKRYEVRGMMEWHPEFKVGRTRLQVPFTGGHLCGGASTPAVFETADPVVQAVIEGSAAYKIKRIRLAAVIDDGNPGMERLLPGRQNADACNADEGHPGSSPSMTFEYTDTEEIFEFLRYQKDVPQSRLMTPDSCFVEAERLGIELKRKEKRP